MKLATRSPICTPYSVSAEASWQARVSDMQREHEKALEDLKSEAHRIKNKAEAAGDYRAALDHLAETVPFEQSTWAMPIGFEKTETGGSCAPGCHELRAYSREKLPDAELEAPQGGPP